MVDALSDESRRFLLDLARESIARKLAGDDIPRRKPNDPVVCAPCGAFVTLKDAGTLRGCIGRLESPQPLWETVAEMAQAAAFDDPRFPAVTREELDGLSIEISVLTPFERLQDPQSVVVGKHGLLVERGFRRGVLLPQVAVEQGWNREEFLAYVCRKASLTPDAWKDPDTALYVFSALVITE
jgi:AmmeMemoRadiSam system protein A